MANEWADPNDPHNYRESPVLQPYKGGMETVEHNSYRVVVSPNTHMDTIKQLAKLWDKSKYKNKLPHVVGSI